MTMYYHQRKGFKRYYKAGDFNQALDDFLSVVPRDGNRVMGYDFNKHVRIGSAP